jgi:hypothetical protein
MSRPRFSSFSPGLESDEHIGHLAVTVNFTTQLCFPFPESIKIIQVVAISGKHNLTVMASLDDMMGAIRKNYAGSAWHKRSLPGRYSDVKN